MPPSRGNDGRRGSRSSSAGRSGGIGGPSATAAADRWRLWWAVVAAAASRARALAVSPGEWPVGAQQHASWDQPASEVGWSSGLVKNEGVDSADPAHLAPIAQTQSTRVEREFDMRERRFPNPDPVERADMLRKQQAAHVERRLRGPFGMGGPDDEAELGKRRVVNNRFKPIEVGRSPGEPIGDSYERAHVLDNELRPGLMQYGGSSLKHYLANGQQGSWGRRISPDYPHIHPSVQVMAPRPGEYEKISGADYLFKPPEIMPPKAPYLYPPTRPGEFPYSVPPEHADEYAHSAPPVAYPEPPPTCIPAKDLPFMRQYTPAHLLEDYCVPIKYLPFYHPSTWRAADQAAPAAGGDPAPGGGGADGPFFVAPPTPSPHFQVPMPFSHGPRFPAFEQLGLGGPPPQVPPPPTANYPVASLLNKAPPLPPPPMPPPMYPY